jgi:hypothetical protein
VVTTTRAGRSETPAPPSPCDTAITPSFGRYRLLETLREYGEELDRISARSEALRQQEQAIQEKAEAERLARINASLQQAEQLTQTEERRAVAQRATARRIYIGRAYHSTARTADEARRINDHIKERKREFVTGLKSREKAEGAQARSVQSTADLRADRLDRGRAVSGDRGVEGWPSGAGAGSGRHVRPTGGRC